MEKVNYPRAKWKVNNNLTIDLITPAELASLPDGTELFDMMGGKCVKGKDYIDDDVKWVFLAFGFRDFDTFIIEELKKLKKISAKAAKAT